ncbi:MAG: hypothetical protein JWN75_1203 [Candidatus Saccharibacteria bacterium]|nr:hypothetical protein [Candidatus Saccharibacteria bacterium]
MFVFNCFKNIITRAPNATAGKALADQCDGYFISTAADLNDLSGSNLVALFNLLRKDKAVIEAMTNDSQAVPPVPVNRFATKEAAVKRVWAMASYMKAAPSEETVREVKAALTETVMSKPAQEALAKAVKAPKEPKVPTTRKSKGVNLLPKETLSTAREGSVQALLIDTLAKGTTFENLREVLHAHAATKENGKPWQDVTIRSGLNWDVNHLKGYGITTAQDGTMTLVYPAGVTGPLPHRAKAEKATTQK